MQHDLSCLEDYEDKKQTHLDEINSAFDEVAKIQNFAMQTALKECPKEFAGTRTPEDCRHCGNESCINAWKKQDELWKKKDEELEKAY